MAMLASYSIKCIFVYILLVSDSTLIHTMKIFVINAMKNIGIFQDISKCHSLERLKGAVNSMEISDIKSKTRDFLILLMNLPKSLIENSLDDVIINSLKTIEHDSNSDRIVLKIEANIVCLKSYMQLLLLEVFGGYGKYEETDQLHCLQINNLCTPRDKHNTSLGGCKITMHWLGNSKYELTIMGANSVIVLVNFFDEMIKILLDDSDSNSLPELEKLHEDNEQRVKSSPDKTVDILGQV